MSVSFDGVGQVCATFLSNDVTEGHMVKLTGNGTVGPCGAGDPFCGVALCAKDDACTVQVCGFVTVGYSGSAPGTGWTALCADGDGGVKTGGDRQVPVVSVDEAAQTVTILL